MSDQSASLCPISLKSMSDQPVTLELLTGDDEMEPFLTGLDFLSDGRLYRQYHQTKLNREIRTTSNLNSICCMSPSQMVVSTIDDPRPARMISVDGNQYKCIADRQRSCPTAQSGQSSHDSWSHIQTR
ncbi:hypothetical protein DPMN_155130 [Dreissena polymorpha]|uniref:Uncharacterized protein n=1 Tax=Dreissena polymorpha TaxID=45954 RepID=A0A9D4FPT7_DREPO|nr:hypothetical protein DPMN_155130 [Dreissena polymorpha]